FGLARGVSSLSVTTKDQVMGTPNYMPPEQWRSSKVDHRADIFATGAVFYELLTFRKAFEADSMEQILYKVLQEEPEPMESVHAALPVELSQIVRKMMGRDIGSRYQDI